MNLRDSITSPRNQVILLLLLSVAALALGVVAPMHRYIATCVAGVAATVAIIRSLLSISVRVTSIQQSIKGISNDVGLSLASELHSMQIVLQRFPECNIPTTSWSLRFTNLHAILEILDERQPTTVVEFGSGISTLLITAWFRERGHGRLVSFDHDESWAGRTRNHLRANQLDEFATVVHAPLVETHAFGQASRWYRVGDCLSTLSDVALVIVDGPPGQSSSGALARLPALEKVQDVLADDCWIVLDDTARFDEQRIVEIWIKHYPQFELRLLSGLSGAAILHREHPKRNRVHSATSVVGSK